MAVPSLNRARIAANSASAANSIRQIHSAEVTYMDAYGTFAPNLVSLGPGAAVNSCPAGGPLSTAACLLDPVLANNIANGGKSGYTFDALAAAGNTDYNAGAAPVAFNTTGVRRFCITSDGVVRTDPNAAGVTAVSTAAGTCIAAPYVPL